MTEHIVWNHLRTRLDQWQGEGRAVRLWLRDDDAVHPTPQLDHLLDLTKVHAVPLTLAVIPEKTGASLAGRLAGEEQTEVAVHGWSHTNYAPPDHKKMELGTHRPAQTVLNELAAGFKTLKGLHGSHFVPLLVPPWNRIAPEVVVGAAELGFRACSTYGPEKPGPLPQINTHVDIMNWRSGGGGYTPERLVPSLIAALEQALHQGSAVGVLTHHLVHDDVAWTGLEQLMQVTANHPAVKWQPVGQLMAELPSNTTAG